GTPKYVSRNCHLEKEQGRRDDLEIWCFMIAEFFHAKNISWRRTSDRDEMYKEKKKFMTAPSKDELALPSQFIEIIKLVDKMTFTCAGDMKTINSLLDDIVKKEDMNTRRPLDWIGKKMPEKKDDRKMRKRSVERVQDDENSDEVRDRRSRAQRRKENAEKRRILEDQLFSLSKDLDDRRTPDEIRAEIRSRERKKRVKLRARLEE
ncbi:hypothetical protein PFISCL1PPCAC_3573, partial [Pristionchus fissidentatus]